MLQPTALARVQYWQQADCTLGGATALQLIIQFNLSFTEQR